MSYRKGATYERELLHLLNYSGFACLRQASSGGYISPVDIVAIRGGLIVAIESKAWSKKPVLSVKKLQPLKDWCDRAGAIGILAWRTRGKWLFLRIEDALERKYEDENWLEMDPFLHALSFR
jgi:Holliday junction resolvase